MTMVNTPAKSVQEAYRLMLTIRLCEERLVPPILDGEVRCPCHLYSGQEAVAVGICQHLQPTDRVFSNHRSHGHYLATGGDVMQLFSEVYGKADGCARGRGGSMHLLAPEHGMLGAAPIVSGTIALAAGAGLAFQVRGEPGVAVTFFGDGATTEGVLFEALNFAALRNLPVIFVCENNFYATHMPIGEIRPPRDIFRIAEAFGIETEQIDGNDLFTVSDVAERAVGACRAGAGPFFIEAQTYRLRGHVGPDDNIQGVHTDIRPPQEIEAWRERDPLLRLEKNMIETGTATADEFAAMRTEVAAEVERAAEHAIAAPYPNPETMLDYVFK